MKAVTLSVAGFVTPLAATRGRACQLQRKVFSGRISLQDLFEPVLPGLVSAPYSSTSTTI